MKTASVAAFIDKSHPRKDGNCSVTIRVTHQRKKKYYPTGLSYKHEEFERVMSAKRRGEADKAIYNKIHSFVEKALQSVEKLPVFTFTKFEEVYLLNRDATNSVSYGFEKYINELREEGRIGTAVSYSCAKKSIESYKSDLKYADITPSFLRKYENWMVEENGNSYTTVGIYLRSLRTVFNRASLDRSLYPFGDEKGKYSIPRGKNVKKALTLDEVSKIFSYEAARGTTEEMARDYWVFMYLCNGINVKDLCLLKRKDIDGKVLTYERAKTKRSKQDGSKIVVSLKPEAKAIIKKWGQPSINPESYIFPHLKKGMTAEREREVIQQLTKTINNYMKLIAKSLKINKQVTTYFARHSFSSILKWSGVSTEFISEALGHSDLKTTQSYLASFEEETIHTNTDALTAFKKAN